MTGTVPKPSFTGQSLAEDGLGERFRCATWNVDYALAATSGGMNGASTQSSRQHLHHRPPSYALV